MPQDEIGQAARSVAVQALVGQREWFDAKELDIEEVHEQAAIYSQVAQESFGSREMDILMMSVFTSGFAMGYNVAEGRSLNSEAGPNPLARDMKLIADAGEDATPNQLRAVARMALLREGIE